MINLVNDSLDPYFNLALEEYLFNKEDNEAYFSLWQNYNTIVVGKNQNPLREINRDYVTNKKIKVSRRMTGGGAVYHDLGNINFTFITPVENESVKYDFKRFTTPIIKALDSFGIKAENQGRNDITIEGKKISGNAQFVSKNKVMHHGTLLFCSDLEAVGKCLNPPNIKLRSNGVSSVKGRVTNIIDYMPQSRIADVYTFGNRLLDFIIEECKIKTSRDLTEEEISAASKLKDEKYGVWNWIYGSSPSYNYEKNQYFEGCGNISFYAEISEGRIENCRFFGDFFGTGKIRDIEETLTGVRIKYEEIEEALSNLEVGYYFNNLSNHQIVSLIAD